MARKRRRFPGNPVPALAWPRPRREGPPRLTSGCGRSGGDPREVRGSDLAYWPGEERRCRPHVTGSDKMARAEKRPDPRCARAAAVGAAPVCLPRVGDRARPLRPEKAPKCPLSAKSGAGPPAPPVSLGFRRRRPVNLESSCSEGAQDSCELGRKSPEPREGSEPRRRLQVGPATRGDRERLRCLSSPPTPERRCPWDITPAHLLRKVPSRREFPRHRDPGAPDETPRP
ncbi:PREDICTED: uncharacterized protein LOC108521352 [Rhinopithecus bieti]|uniref:uncharacterized protein LOC108521352 n=1 Tax=Rhinopithecus bieti TaxID=61621 RepID=UPI00083BE6CF|nr:PREDICTED: uncharacterized protein LOC108521352 [Rhinopithecus bieti]